MDDSQTIKSNLVMRRIMIAYIAGGILTVPASCVWTSQGWGLPSLDYLKVGMTKPEVVAVVGPPSSAGARPDGTSWMTITRSQSLDWIALEFDAKGLLRSFHYERF